MSVNGSPFSIRGDGGSDTIQITTSGLNSQSSLDLTPLLLSSSEVENVNLDIASASLDLSRVAAMNVDYFSQQPLWIDGKAGTRFQFRTSGSSFVQENSLTRGGTTYDVLRDEVTGFRIALSTNLDITANFGSSSPAAQFTLAADLQPILHVSSPEGRLNLQLSSDAAYANAIGFYPLASVDGTIEDPVTGAKITSDDRRYFETARQLAEQSGFVSFAPNSTAEAPITATKQLATGYWAPIVKTTIGPDKVNHYTPFASQTDLAQHFRIGTGNLLEFEDLPLAQTDLDFNDVNIRIL
jgi:hypothetical protein